MIRSSLLPLTAPASPNNKEFRDGEEQANPNRAQISRTLARSHRRASPSRQGATAAPARSDTRSSAELNAPAANDRSSSPVRPPVSPITPTLGPTQLPGDVPASTSSPQARRPAPASPLTAAPSATAAPGVAGFAQGRRTFSYSQPDQVATSALPQQSLSLSRTTRTCSPFKALSPSSSSSAPGAMADMRGSEAEPKTTRLPTPPRSSLICKPVAYEQKAIDSSSRIPERRMTILRHPRTTTTHRKPVMPPENSSLLVGAAHRHRSQLRHSGTGKGGAATS